MTHIDGSTLEGDQRLRCDVVIVGSGPAGSTVARELAASGVDVLVLEAGPLVTPDRYPRSALRSMSTQYRDWGASVVLGRAPMPYVQGRMVGGGSPINGAICWRLPRDVWAEWVDADPSLADALPFDELESITGELERRLGVSPTDAAIAGRKNELMAQGANALGLEHRPIRRNVVGCEGLGRCLEGCPAGRKRSVDRTLLEDAQADGARLMSQVEVQRVRVTRRGDRATGVEARAASGARVLVEARDAVVVAASAVQSPVLLLKSGLGQGPVGRHFSCHPGVSMAARYREPVRMWQGATQGHEVIGLRHEGLKFEVLGFGLAVLASRLPGVGAELSRGVAELGHWLDWGAAVRAESEGRVRCVAGRTLVTYTPNARDVRLFRRGLRVLGEMMLAAGAESLHPGVRGFDAEVRRVADLERLESDGPTSPAAFTSAITHMFGTCRMGQDPARSVVRPDFRHHAIEALYVADSSVFPSNIGVNPQLAIMAMATLCARSLLHRNGVAC
ncbi:MAG: GMC family oxidoreductase [Deltaproteobacteria bacterium]|nr:GMC family oxidoreductase [Deltaproteobacteria bacterium]